MDITREHLAAALEEFRLAVRTDAGYQHAGVVDSPEDVGAALHATLSRLAAEFPERFAAAPPVAEPRAGPPGCPFCDRIAAGEYDYSDNHSVAFQPLLPVTPGHFLVVPRRHAAHALESPALASRALRFAARLANDVGLDAANFITSAGLAATQSVFHLHVHVVPRRHGDGLVLPWTHQQAELTKLPGAVAGILL